MLTTSNIVLSKNRNELLKMSRLRILSPTLTTLNTRRLNRQTSQNLMSVNRFGTNQIRLITYTRKTSSKNTRLLTLRRRHRLTNSDIGNVRRVIMLNGIRLILYFQTGRTPINNRPSIQIGIISTLHDRVCLVLPCHTTNNSSLTIRINRTSLVVVSRVRYPRTTTHRHFRHMTTRTTSTRRHRTKVIRFFRDFHTRRRLHTKVLVLRFILLIAFPLSW